MRLRRRRWRPLASPPVLMLLLLCLMEAPQLGVCCCGRSGTGSGAGSSPAGGRKDFTRRRFGNRELVCRSLEEALADGSLKHEDRVRLHKEAEGMLQLHADGLRLMRDLCEADRRNDELFSSENRRSARDNEIAELREFGESIDRRVRSGGWRQLLGEYRQQLSALDARLRRVEREGVAARERPRGGVDWGQDYEWEREREHDWGRSRETFRYSRGTSQDEDVQADVHEILRLAQKNGLESLAYEQLVLLHEAVAMAASHSTVAVGNAIPEGAEVEEVDGELVEEEADDEQDVVVIGAEDGGIEMVAQYITVVRRDEGDTESASVMTSSTQGVGYAPDDGDEIAERMSEVKEDATDDEEEEEDSEVLGEGEGEGEEEEVEVEESEVASKPEGQDDLRGHEGDSERPSSRPSSSLSMPSMFVEHTACPLCPSVQPSEADANPEPVDGECSYGTRQETVCAVQLQGLATIETGYPYAIDRLAEGLSEGGEIEWVGRVCGMSLGPQELIEGCPLEGVLHQPVPLPSQFPPEDKVSSSKKPSGIKKPASEIQDDETVPTHSAD